MRLPLPNRRSTALLLSALYLAAAALIVTNLDLRLFAPEKLGSVFNDMARRLLVWDFTIDPAAIQYEAFVRDGKTYTYYGFFPALLRMPLVLAGHGNLQVGRISCLIALTLTVYAYLRLLQAALPRLPGPGRLSWIVLLSAILTGPQVYLLASASLYHELIFWSAALTAWFNLIVIRRWLAGEEMPLPEMLVLAVLAGLDLWCRYTCGAALMLALLLLLCRAAWLCSPGKRWLGLPRPSMQMLRLMSVGCLALAFVAALGIVNHERWGEWWDTAPLRYYGQFQSSPDNTGRLARHGVFSLVRVGMATAYYMTGLKLESIVPGLFDDYYGGVEGPRAWPVLCAPLYLFLILVSVGSVLRRRSLQAVPLLLGIGNLAGVVVTLGFLALTLRYTFDAWGLVTLLATLGVHRLTLNGGWSPRYSSFSVIGCATLLLIIGTAVSAATLLRYKIVYSGTDPSIRYKLSRLMQPIVCPAAHVTVNVDLTAFNPLVSPSCPPLW